MHETFKRKQRGDKLTAKHVNKLSAVSRRVSAGATGSYLSGIHSSIMAVTTPPPFQQELVTVKEETSTPGIYDVQRMYWDSEAELWTVNLSANELLMDANAIGATYSEGDVVTVWWHRQRGAYVPTVMQQTTLKIGKAYGSLAVGTTAGSVKVWEDGAETAEVLTGVHHDWITNDQAIADGTEVILGWFAGESCWRVIGAECP